MADFDIREVILPELMVNSHWEHPPLVSKVECSDLFGDCGQ